MNCWIHKDDYFTIFDEEELEMDIGASDASPECWLTTE